MGDNYDKLSIGSLFDSIMDIGLLQSNQRDHIFRQGCLFHRHFSLRNSYDVVDSVVNPRGCIEWNPLFFSTKFSKTFGPYCLVSCSGTIILFTGGLFWIIDNVF